MSANIEKYFFLIGIIWYIYKYGLTPTLCEILNKFYNVANDFFIYKNIGYYDEENNQANLLNNDESTREKVINEEKPQIKYEDKYLKDIRKLNKEWVFTQEEVNELTIITQQFYDAAIENKKNRLEEITKEITHIEKLIAEDNDSMNYVEDFNEDYYSESDEVSVSTSSNSHEILERINEERQKQITCLKEEYDSIVVEIETEDGLLKLKTESENHAHNHIVGKRLEKLNNCYVIEKTPNGNVLMIYDNNKETFKYYSDSTVPYRYLEVVGRKYVKFFDCRPLFVDMEEELKLVEEKYKKESEQDLVVKEENDKTEQKTATQQKKNVFAKFKSYNKEAGGKISMAAPPKNSIPNKIINEKKENEKIILKEKANRYTYEGKFANFNFLQRIERKVFNKRLGLSFNDFKRMMQK